MEESVFVEKCDQKLSELFDKVEAFDEDSRFDIDYADGILTIDLIDSDKSYVINRNVGNMKIWFSSPVSGADYFSYDKDSSLWIGNHGDELEKKLFTELKTL